MASLTQVVVIDNDQSKTFPYNHYDGGMRKKAMSCALPMVAIDRQDAKPLHRQIYDSFRAMIFDRRLRPDSRFRPAGRWRRNWAFRGFPYSAQTRNLWRRGIWKAAPARGRS